VQCEAAEEVNYSLLHNDRPLLTTLTLTSWSRSRSRTPVQVELNLGAQNYPFRCTQLVLDEPQLALAPVRIPLTAAPARSGARPVDGLREGDLRRTDGMETTERVT
jgi:hypothetical protein